MHKKSCASSDRTVGRHLILFSRLSMTCYEVPSSSWHPSFFGCQDARSRSGRVTDYFRAPFSLPSDVYCGCPLLKYWWRIGGLSHPTWVCPVVCHKPARIRTGCQFQFSLVQRYLFLIFSRANPNFLLKIRLEACVTQNAADWVICSALGKDEILTACEVKMNGRSYSAHPSIFFPCLLQTSLLACDWFVMQILLLCAFSVCFRSPWNALSVWLICQDSSLATLSVFWNVMTFLERKLWVGLWVTGKLWDQLSVSSPAFEEPECIVISMHKWWFMEILF